MLPKKNKKALSEIVGYTILIVIALALASMVTVFLTTQVNIFKPKPGCNEEINLIVGDVACSFSKGELNITLINKGLFKADAAYLRFGNETQKLRQQINKDNFLLFGPGNTDGLNPGESSSAIYNISEQLISKGSYILELQPAIIQNKQLVVCENSIIFQTVQCK